jgi:hypothetical protein
VTLGFGLCFRLVAWEWFDKAKVLLQKLAGYLPMVFGPSDTCSPCKTRGRG